MAFGKNPAAIGRTRHAQGVFTPQNPQKYIGSNPPVYRSSWERDFMITCDVNPAVSEWAAEPFSIPYQCPLTGKRKNYWVDFIIKFMDADGVVRQQVVEIKPYKFTMLENVKSKKDKQTVLVNNAKWIAAKQFCEVNGLEFQLYTEKDLYR